MKELKQLLRASSVDFSDCIEKCDLVTRAFESELKPSQDVNSDEEDDYDFMHGYTAVYAISSLIQL